MQDKKVVTNAIWLITCRVIQTVINFVISMMTARYLGPSNYGIISYAASIVAFFAPVMNLGLSSILVHEYVNNREEEGGILGTSLVLNAISGLLCVIGVNSFCLIMNPGERDVQIVCALYSVVLIIQALENIQYWFQAKLLSKYYAVLSLVAYLSVACYKVFLLVTNRNVYWFAISNTIDYLIITIGLFVVYYLIGREKIYFSIQIARRMLTQSKYYIISGLMTTVLAQTDRIMLKSMLDETIVGYYSAAVTCASTTSFVFTAIIDSMRPLIFEGKKISIRKYEERIKNLYSITVYTALLQSVLLFCCAKIVIHILYGSAYGDAVPILRVVVWYAAFSYFGGAKDIWILAEKKQKYLIWLNVSGAAINVALNYLLIPLFGAVGAAMASIITQFFTNIIMEMLISDLRHNIDLLMEALHPKYLKSIVKNFRSALK